MSEEELKNISNKLFKLRMKISQIEDEMLDLENLIDEEYL